MAVMQAMQPMQAISPLWDTMPLKPISAEPAVKSEEESKVINPFTDIFQAAIEAVKETDAEKNEMEYLMATGQLDNPALLTIASTKAQLSVELLVQLRSKVMDAYSELMRINL